MNKRFAIVCALSILPAANALAQGTTPNPTGSQMTVTSSSALTFAMRIGELPRPKASVSAPLKPEPPRPSFAPEPPPLSATRTWLYEVTLRAGVLGADGPVAIDHQKPVTTPRRLGRYALELWIGKEILERIRFDLPSIPDDAPRPGRPLGTPQGTARLFVELPDNDRATYVLLVDRDTGASKRIAYPPADYPPPNAVILGRPKPVPAAPTASSSSAPP